MKTTTIVTRGVIVILAIALSSGCEVGVNPLLFDGSPVEASFPINTSSASFASEVNTDLGEVLKDISDEFDSVNVFNITLQIENTGNMVTTTSFDGSAAFNDSVLVSFTGIPLSRLLKEQSMFRITGVTVNKRGILYLKRAINTALRNPGTPSIAKFTIAGNSSQTPVHITPIVRVYTQVFTKKK